MTGVPRASNPDTEKPMTRTLRMFAAAFAAVAAAALFSPTVSAQGEQQRLVNAAK